MIKYITEIPNINGQLIPNKDGINIVYLFLEDSNNSYLVSRDREVKTNSLIYTYESGTLNHKAITDYLAQIEKKNDTLTATTTFEQFNNILQTTALLAIAGGAIYYFFFYDKKGKKK